MLDAQKLQRLVEAALEEDIGRGDATTWATVPEASYARARVVAKAAGVLAGRPVFEAVFRTLSSACHVHGADDGRALVPGQTVWEIDGPARALLAGERVGLNFVQHLSGIATLTSRFVQAVAGCGVAITDTRKTTPGLRFLEKYAVRCGGGSNHRESLDAMLLVKENHIAAAGSLERAVSAALSAADGRAVEVEVRDLAALREVLKLHVDRIMLDHWSPSQVREAVALRGETPPPELEVSGNLSLERIGEYALPGVQFLSVGALTHSAPALDLSMLFAGVGGGTT